MIGFSAFKKTAAIVGAAAATVVLVGASAVANDGGSFPGVQSVNNCDPSVSSAGCTDILPTNILAVNRASGPSLQAGQQTVIAITNVPDGHYKAEAKTVLSSTAPGTSNCILFVTPGGAAAQPPVDSSSFSPGMTIVNENLEAAVDLSSSTGFSTVTLACSFDTLWSATWSKIILEQAQYMSDVAY